jgi:hypothetical protein
LVFAKIKELEGIMGQSGWTKQQVKTFLLGLRARWGVGWELLGRELQNALVDQLVTEVVTSSAIDVPVSQIRQLRHDLLIEAGLNRAAVDTQTGKRASPDAVFVHLLTTGELHRR